jgi:hypothetical protein
MPVAISIAPAQQKSGGKFTPPDKRIAPMLRGQRLGIQEKDSAGLWQLGLGMEIVDRGASADGVELIQRELGVAFDWLGDSEGISAHIMLLGCQDGLAPVGGGQPRLGS